MIYSRQREIILETLAELHGLHPSANELYAHLRVSHPSMSLATVYRNLGQLDGAGIIARIPMPGGADRYDDVNDGHLHMICDSCARVYDLPRSLIDGLAQQAASASGHDISSCAILFFGVCDACKERNNTNIAQIH